MILIRLRRPVLEQFERAVIQLYSVDRGIIRGITEEFGEREILGSMAIYVTPAGGGVLYALAYDRKGREFPISLGGWKRSLVEIEGALALAVQGIEAAMSPLAITTDLGGHPAPALSSPAWEGWGPVQAAGCFGFFLAAAVSSSVLRLPDAGVG